MPPCPQFKSTKASARQDADALLREALRLPSEDRVVADWIFDEQELDFHVKSNSVPPDAFDTARVMVSKSNFIPGHDTPLPCSSFQQFTGGATNDCTTLFMLHLLAKESHGIYMGYTFTIGSPFEEGLLPVRDAFNTYCLIGRFVMDHDRRHFLVYISNFTPNTSLLMALNWHEKNHRQRIYFSFPNDEYNFQKMPSKVIGVTINDEYLVPGQHPGPSPSPGPFPSENPRRPHNHKNDRYHDRQQTPPYTPPSPSPSPSSPQTSSRPSRPSRPSTATTSTAPPSFDNQIQNHSPDRNHGPAPASSRSSKRSREESTVTKASAYRSLLPTGTPWVEDVTALHPNLLDTFETQGNAESPALPGSVFEVGWSTDNTSFHSFLREPPFKERGTALVNGYESPVKVTAFNYFADFRNGISTVFQGTFFSPAVIRQIGAGLGESTLPSIVGQIKVQIETATPHDMQVLQTFARRRYYAETQPVSPDEYYITSDRAENVTKGHALCSIE